MSFNGKGWHLWDFREKQSEVYEPTLTLAQRIALAQAQRDADLDASASAALPSPAMHHVQDWPAEARVWFYKAGINNDDIAHMGAYWHAGMRRVIVPYVTVTGEEAWIGRNVGLHDGPKYLFPAGVTRGGGALFQRDPRVIPTGTVIVEDVLSAYRIAKATDFAAVAAQGTSLDRHTVARIAQTSAVNFTWLDPDSYGQAGAQTLLRDFARMGVPIRNIRSDRDPKFHEDAEIREAVEA